MVDDLQPIDDAVGHAIEHLSVADDVAPVFCTIAAILLDPRAYAEPKHRQPTDSLRAFIHRSCLTSRSFKAFIESSDLHRLRYREGWFEPTFHGFPSDETKDTRSYEYDVCISYTSEDRALAKRLARKLEKKYFRTVFFDEFQQHKTAGQGLDELLYDVYANRSVLCLALFSRTYLERTWTQHEYSAARHRAMADKQMYLIPVVLDLEAVPDELRTTTALWPYSRTTEDRLAEYVNDQVWSRIKHRWIPEDEILPWVNQIHFTDVILKAFDGGIRAAFLDGERPDLLRLFGVLTVATMADLVRPVHTMLDFVVTSVPAVTKRLDRRGAVAVSDDLSVMPWPEKDGPLIMSESWTDFFELHRWGDENEDQSDENEGQASPGDVATAD